MQAFANLRAKLEELAKTYSNFYTLLPGQQEEAIRT